MGHSGLGGDGFSFQHFVDCFAFQGWRRNAERFDSLPPSRPSARAAEWMAEARLIATNSLGADWDVDGYRLR